MTWARPETIQLLFKEACNLPVVDAHTHVQDDLINFTEELANSNLAGTQASINAYPAQFIQRGVRDGRLARRTMVDVAHGCFYSWFAEVVEGNKGRLDPIIGKIGDNSESARQEVARLLAGELQGSRFSEYAEWLRYMFRLYLPDSGEADPLSPENLPELHEAVASKRNDPEFASSILRDHKIMGYVTSIENRDNVPLDPAQVHIDELDFSYSTHAEAYNMMDLHYLIWPEGATDFGLVFGDFKYQSKNYVSNLERVSGESISSLAELNSAVSGLLRKILYCPKGNPTSRVRYCNLFQPIGTRLAHQCDSTRADSVVSNHRDSLEGDDLSQVTAAAMEAALETLDKIGANLNENGAESGSCLQIAVGATYFMDPDREIQSFPVYAAGFPQDEYEAWIKYPNIHFEYIVAHHQLYEDLANAAKQVGNVSVGPWWHFFREHKLAAMIKDQLSMGPIRSIASGFTDARFVEMLAAKHRSVRRAVAIALAELVDDPQSSMTVDSAREVMREILFDNPRIIHHLPIEVSKG